MVNFSPLRSARKKAGLSIESVEAKLGIAAGNVSRIERGEQYPGRDILEGLLKLFPDLTSDEILFPNRASRRGNSTKRKRTKQ